MIKVGFLGFSNVLVIRASKILRDKSLSTEYIISIGSARNFVVYLINYKGGFLHW